MGNNSIRSNLTKEYIVSDLKLSLAEDIYKEKVFVIVEGEDDIKFLKSYFKYDTAILYESYDGKNGVSEIVKKFYPNDRRVIGIRDRDYLEREESPKIFFYDNCCLEMMIVENEEVFNSIYNEFYEGDMQSGNLRKKILLELKKLSIIRMFNEKFQWEINFRALSINNVFKRDIYVIDNEKVVEELNRINDNKINDNMLENINEYAKQVQTVQDLLKITQGHDFSTLFVTICNIYTNKHFNSKSVERALRCSYRNKDFEKTELYNSLATYQENIGIKFLTTYVHT